MSRWCALDTVHRDLVLLMYLEFQNSTPDPHAKEAMDKAQEALVKAQGDFFEASDAAKNLYKKHSEGMTFQTWINHFMSIYTAMYNNFKVAQGTFNDAFLKCEGSVAARVIQYRNRIANTLIETTETPGYV
jgi:hypothetical protein